MFALQKKWSLDPFPHEDNDLVMSLVQFGETLGVKCFALLEGKEGAHQRTYLGFGEGWVLTPETFRETLIQSQCQAHDTPDPLVHLRKFRETNSPQMELESGIIGYLDYEWGLYWQKPKASLTKPRYFFRLCPINIVLLPLTRELVLEFYTEDKEQLAKNFDFWVKELNQFLTGQTNKNYNYTSQNKTTDSNTKNNLSPSKWQPNMSREDFITKIERIKEYIRAGDIFQAVFSQRFTLKTPLEPWAIYHKLRAVNPSPWLFCIHGKEETLVGSSPELLLSSSGKIIKTRPIAGTRPRGKTSEEDSAREQELLNDPKEMAEHAMLVDLGRNDIGRVAKYGSVKVSEYTGVQYFSHVMHIVSTVEGEPDTPYDSLDALKAVLPAGTLSGAPKVRAMEILQEAESSPREAYGGALGILRWNGEVDFCITIRTLIFNESEVSVQAGAGIVLDSVPEREYEETLHKARALFTVVDLAN